MRLVWCFFLCLWLCSLLTCKRGSALLNIYLMVEMANNIINFMLTSRWRYPSCNYDWLSCLSPTCPPFSKCSRSHILLPFLVMLLRWTSLLSPTHVTIAALTFFSTCLKIWIFFCHGRSRNTFSYLHAYIPSLTSYHRLYITFSVYPTITTLRLHSLLTTESWKKSLEFLLTVKGHF